MASDRENIEARFNDAIRRLVLWMAGIFVVALLIAMAVKSLLWR